ncbi:hypothetical protein Q1695_006285 [Nippostrongylus brasiliensis]|nr:hypothetical protein Q1695_006285 [Nippostrongylus brasiliensis]
MAEVKASAIPLLDFKPGDDDTSNDECSLDVSCQRRQSWVKISSGLGSAVKIDLDQHEDEDVANLSSLVHRYARNGDVDAVDGILSSQPDLVNEVDHDGLTALHYAAKYGNLKVVELLLNRGAAVDIAGDEQQWTPLHMTAKYCRAVPRRPTSRSSASSLSMFIDASAHRTGEAVDSAAAIVNLLVSRGAQVDAADTYGMTPLHYAAMKDNGSAARALIRNHANVNAKTIKGTTPLLTACVYGSDDIITLLLSSGADCSFTDNRMNSVYHIAALHGRIDSLKLLLQYGGLVAKKLLWMNNNEGKTALRMAVDGNHPQTVAAILKLKPKDDFEFNEKDTLLLHEAAAKGYVRVVECLIENGYNPRLRDEDLNLPIHAAAEKNRADVVERLVQLAPDTMEEQNDVGMTPYLVAAYNNALDVVKVLVQHGIDVCVTDNEGRTAIYVGSKYNAIEVLRYLLDLCRQKRKADDQLFPDLVNQPDHCQMTPMHVVCGNGYIEVSRILYEFGASIEALNEEENTPLHLAAERGQTICVRQLLEWDKRLVLHKNEDSNTALHLAAKYGKAETTRVLLEAGADIEAKNSHEDTALQCAVYGGHLATVRQLLQAGAVIENKDDERDSTPLHMASAKGHDSIVRLLLDHGATINRRDENDKTALDLALENGHREVARALVESDDWLAIMSPVSTVPVGRHSHARVTPLRKLIEKFPEIAEIVFSRCIRYCGEDSHDVYFFTEYYFDLIDDTYMMPTKDGTVSPYKEDGSLKPEAKAYSDDYDVIYKNHPLKIMSKCESLLGHELVRALLKYKWNSLGRYVYYFALGVYLLFLCLFTLYITHTPAPFNVFDDEGREIVLNDEDLRCPNVSITRPAWLVMCKRMVIGLGVAQLIKELFQLITRRLRYISFENAVECFIYTSAIVTVTDLSPCSETTGLRLHWQWLLAAACSFLSWMNLLLLVRKLPRFGIYVVMFFDVLRTFSRFFLVFALFVIAFSIAFFVIMQNRPEFSTLTSAVLKTTVMMIGEFEFTAIFHGDAETHTERLFGHAIAYPLFLFFCVIMTILLMNLLVGLAVDDIKSVLEEAKLKRLSMQADLVLQVEASMPFIRKLTCKSTMRVYPNQTSFLKRLRNRFGLDSSTEVVMEDRWESKEQELFTEFRKVIRGQNEKLRVLQDNVDVMYSTQLKTEAMLRAVMESLQVEFQETAKD